MNKFIGTIIDKSYFDFYRENDNLYQMCCSCDRPRLLRDKDGLTRGKKHYCEDKKNWGWVYFMNWEWGQFVFIHAYKDLSYSNRAQVAYIAQESEYCKCKTRKGRIVDGWSHFQCLECKLPILGVNIKIDRR